MDNFQMPIREKNSHKGTFGKVLNICGSENYIGAAYLSAVSSLKVGAGFSALATEQHVINSVSCLLPEVVYLTREQGLEKLDDFSVVLIGCGLGLKENSKKRRAKTP
jgi:NAD(P)H-hydrate repair Nnr-like enzyme with NAD(P)H-hydrate dehydratase domain